MKQVKALIDSCETSNIILPSRLRKLELPQDAAFTPTQDLNGPVMVSAKASRMASLLVQYFEPHNLVDESHVSFIRMTAYNLVLGLRWFKTTITKIDGTNGRLRALGTPNPGQWAKIPDAEQASPLPEHGKCQGLLGASLEGITKGEEDPRMLNPRPGAAAVVVAED